MRVSSSMIFDQLTSSFQRNMEELSKLNKQLASGKKIDTPSEDVIGTIKAMDYKLSIANNDQYKNNITEAKSYLEYTNTVFTTVTGSLSKLKGFALEGASDTLTPELRTILETEVSQTRDFLLDLSNSNFRGKYIFSGFKTDIKAFDPATFDYQGDSGIMNVMTSKGISSPVNITGSSAFSYTLSAPEVVQNSGNFIHYTPGAGTTTNVEIRASDDTTVLDNFSFSNFIQMTDIMSSALNTNNIMRVKALLKPIDNARNQALNVQADIGIRVNNLNDQNKSMDSVNLNLKNVLSSTEDADITEIITHIQQMQVSLQALMQSASRIMSQSLMDFLK